MHLAIGITLKLVPSTFMQKHFTVLPDHLTYLGDMNHAVLGSKERVDDIGIIFHA
ncbi:MAG: hypothetical protein JETT_0014 [Candidatus Jettenia ecosi]|uniref:Uncharacterized protein n=1 Tax=Candidatus Jettenia ecosi TaxID=2494326 RepID=A0A533QFM6_9BACT|nr:MAG: hypothetical protein JETT_0014 [Candidatus Jettenia ecosi]